MRWFRELPTSTRVLIGILTAGLVGCAAIVLITLVTRWRGGMTAAERFEAETGMRLPAGSQVVLAEDTHGGLTGDGDLVIVIEAPPAGLRAWVKEKPPWGRPTWEPGFVPWEAVGYLDIGAIVDGARSRGVAVPTWVEDHDRTTHAAIARGPGGSWHNGTVLAVDPEHGRIWLLRWDL